MTRSRITSKASSLDLGSMDQPWDMILKIGHRKEDLGFKGGKTEGVWKGIGNDSVNGGVHIYRPT